MNNIFLNDKYLLMLVKSVAYKIVDDWSAMGCPCDINEWLKDEFVPFLAIDVEYVALIKQKDKEGWGNAESE